MYLVTFNCSFYDVINCKSTFNSLNVNEVPFVQHPNHLKLYVKDFLYFIYDQYQSYVVVTSLINVGLDTKKITLFCHTLKWPRIKFVPREIIIS